MKDHTGINFRIVAVLKKMVSGSLIETIVSIVILTTILAIAYATIIQINSGPAIQVLNVAAGETDEIIFKAIHEDRFFDEEYTIGGLKISKTVQVSKELPVIFLRVETRDVKEKLIYYRQMVLPNENLQN